MLRGKTKFAVGLLAVTGIAVLATEQKQQLFEATEKAFYAAESLLNFVRPGLAFQVTSAQIATDGTITTRFKVVDKAGVGIDKDGLNTPGPVAISFVVSTLDKTTNQYRSYIFRTQTSPITSVSAQQPTSENNGVFTKIADGEYIYTFRNKAPAGYDATATHTIGVYGNRNLTDFDLGTNYASTTFNFVPNGSPVTQVHDVIKNATCNACHGDINAHGGSRRGIQTCVLCHYEGVKDPDTGNDIGLATMSHKLHMGSQLPSVVAGTPYQIIGFNQTVADYSKVVFPADIRSCSTCHVQTGANAGAQATRVYQASRFACGSCHDDVNFATGKNHIAQANDDSCTQCHRPQGTREFDISITGAHTIPEMSTSLPNVIAQIVNVSNNQAGQKPTVQFRLTDKTGAVVAPSDMNSLSLYIGGSAADYTTFFSEAATRATLSPSGTATYSFTNPIPATATGTYSVHIEGYRNVVLPTFGTKTVTVRDAIRNPIAYFTVDGTKQATPRRTSVTDAKCNACHRDLNFHGFNRNKTEVCVICHNATQTDAGRRTAAQLPAEGISFGMMIHRIHNGENLPRPYVIYGFGGNATDFSDVAFPGDLKNCAACHVNNSQYVPLPATVTTAVTDPRGFWTTPGPAASNCLGCHSSRDEAAHAYLNTSPIGESCGACHSAGKEYGVDKVHAQ